eukprot:CAMPEP_0181293088 /NCGR_PEP_ID=MMETSP1101-20121128/2873_1 /TAXON_ID=46948 /ORGANISM="Rhodomonas abbreviata, Strain Caron Lab Isolate" /LENGTH=385 /DNA_ID=CAMNT_0023397641 /DNA_START=76 /DNA_END=1233 /DNA_ORIENTATION=-
MVGTLPWPRGRPPKFDSPVPDRSQGHWKTVEFRCGSCGCYGACVHKNKHLVEMNNKFQEGKEHRPGFMLEGSLWRNQLEKVEKESGKLRAGQSLPPGTRHGWGSHPGSDAKVGSPRRHGEWKLVFVPRNKQREEHVQHHPERSKSVTQKNHARALVPRDDERPVAHTSMDIYRDGHSFEDAMKSPTPGPFSTVQQMDFFSAARETDLKLWKQFGFTTPDIVRELNNTALPSIPTAQGAGNISGNRHGRREGDGSSRRRQGGADLQFGAGTTKRNDGTCFPGDSGELLTTSSRHESISTTEWMDKTSRDKRVKKLLGGMPDGLKTQIEGRPLQSLPEVPQDSAAWLPAPQFRERKPGECLEQFFWIQSRKPKKRTKKVKKGQDFRF